MADSASNAPEAFVFYKYKPSMAAAVIFIMLFIAATSVHIFQMIKHKAWFFTAFIIGGCCKLDTANLLWIPRLTRLCSRVYRLWGARQVFTRVSQVYNRPLCDTELASTLGPLFLRRIHLYDSWTYHSPDRRRKSFYHSNKVAHYRLCERRYHILPGPGCWYVAFNNSSSPSSTC